MEALNRMMWYHGKASVSAFENMWQRHQHMLMWSLIPPLCVLSTVRSEDFLLLVDVPCRVSKHYVGVRRQILVHSGARCSQHAPKLHLTFTCHRTGRTAAVSEAAIKGRLHDNVLDPVLNEAWELTGVKCSLLYEPLLSSLARPFEVDGIKIKQSALLPDFPGTAPAGYERTYGQAQPQAHHQPPIQGHPQPGEASAQLETAAVLAATESGIQAQGLQSPLQPQDAEQPLEPQLQNLLLAVEGSAVKNGVPMRCLERSAPPLHRRLTALEGRRVRIGFIGEAKREGVLVEAIQGSMPQLWRGDNRMVRSVIRQVRWQV